MRALKTRHGRHFCEFAGTQSEAVSAPADRPLALARRLDDMARVEHLSRAAAVSREVAGGASRRIGRCTALRALLTFARDVRWHARWEALRRQMICAAGGTRLAVLPALRPDRQELTHAETATGHCTWASGPSRSSWLARWPQGELQTTWFERHGSHADHRDSRRLAGGLPAARRAADRGDRNQSADRADRAAGVQAALEHGAVGLAARAGIAGMAARPAGELLRLRRADERQRAKPTAKLDLDV